MSSSTTSKYDFLEPPTIDGDLGSIGPYRVLAELGRGGMGYVFRAEDTRLKRVVALKMMNAKIAATNHSRQRFIEEARSMAAVKHDNVATIYEVNDQYGTPFMAMEILRGGTLEAYTNKHQKFDYHQVIKYATEIARGLGAAHAQGIIHRDIKPANLWIEEGIDRVKILDFGLALAQAPMDPTAGRGSVVGTPQYLSPEQARSEPLDNRTDLYSLGVVLYELCTGELPFKARTVPEMLIATLVQEPTPVHQVNPAVPEPLSRLIATLMKKEPRHRPRSADALEKMLEKVAVECDAKSDVALTINKLQEQLSRVAGKQGDPFAAKALSYDEPIEVENYSVNPFDAIPTAAFAPAVRVGTMPVAPLGTPVRPAVKPPQIAKPAPAQSGLPTYWPFIAAGAGAFLLLVFVLGFWFATSSSSPPIAATSTVDKNVVGVNAVDANAIAPKPTPPTPAAKQSQVSPPVADDNRVSTPPTKAPDPPTKKPAAKNKKRPPAKADANKNMITDNLNSVTPPVNEPVSQPTESMASGLDSIASLDVTEPSKPKVFKEVTRKTGDGRGADTTVKNGGRIGEQLGIEPSVVVQTRNQKDVQHAYLRFDFGDDKKDFKNVGKATVILSFPRGSAPESGSEVRIYGVPENFDDNWLEKGPRSMVWKNSLSSLGLDSVPLLAQVSIAPENLDGSGNLQVVDDRLTEFVRGIGEDFITLLLAGGSPNNKPLHMVSREGGEGQSPTLELEIVEADGAKKSR
jgi:serine/threonine protein kinase